jgi:hypothetical protein
MPEARRVSFPRPPARDAVPLVSQAPLLLQTGRSWVASLPVPTGDYLESEKSLPNRASRQPLGQSRLRLIPELSPHPYLDDLRETLPMGPINPFGGHDANVPFLGARHVGTLELVALVREGVGVR